MHCGFMIVNLLIPEAPDEISINGKYGDLTLLKTDNYKQVLESIIRQGMCANTYVLSMERENSSPESALRDLMIFCLASSYVSGSAVTVSGCEPSSELQILEISEKLPRQRSISRIEPLVNNAEQFKSVIEKFITNYGVNLEENIIYPLINNYIDSLSCFSLEDSYLSLTTVLQIIKKWHLNCKKKKMSLYKTIDSLSRDLNITRLNEDFKNMRNDLIHEGALSGTSFNRGKIKNIIQQKTKRECIRVCCDVFNWIDECLHSILELGNVNNIRFDESKIIINAYSVN